MPKTENMRLVQATDIYIYIYFYEKLLFSHRDDETKKWKNMNSTDTCLETCYDVKATSCAI